MEPVPIPRDGGLDSTSRSEQDLRIRHNRIPATPESGFVMTGVQITR